MIKRLLAFAVLIAVGLGGVGAYYALTPYRSMRPETFIEVKRGMSSRQIGETLAAAGVLRSAWVFLAVRIAQPQATLQAGEYRFGPAQSPWEIFQKIRRGEVFFEQVTIPEGSNRFDIANILRNGDTVKAEDFLAAASEPASIRDLDPAAPSLEGYLFPSSYRVTHKTTAKELCAMMTGEFRKVFRNIAAGRELNVHHIVTLASLIEKETAVPQERTLMAAVFENRLQRNMPLQCDPTVIYAALLTNRYRGAIHRSDLTNDSPYNTYTHIGLPPGPIANPGLVSLQAAAKPDASPYLYFVAKPDGSGGHRFSATLEEHNQAVAAFRHAQ